jgi:hypothetical protein
MSRTNARFVTCLMLICWTASLVPASAQHFKQIDGSLTQIAVGRAEVWGLDGSETYRFDSSSQKFNKISGSLTQIAVGGGTLLQSDEVWGVNAAGGIYHFSFSKKKFETVAGSLKQIAVGEGDEDSCHPYEVWGIDPEGNLWRYNYCDSKFEAGKFSGAFAQVAVGQNDVWALAQDGQIAHLDPNGGGNVTGGLNGTLQQIAVGVNDAWGIDANGALYRYYGSFGQPEFLSADALPCSSPCEAGQVTAGGDGVWVVYTYQDGSFPAVGIARLTYSTDKEGSSAGFFNNVFSVLTVSQSVVQLAVGSGGGVWVITSSLGPKFKKSYQVYAWVRP